MKHIISFVRLLKLLTFYMTVFTLNKLGQKRAIYDKHGDQVLKEGLIENGELVGKYKFTSDPEQIFEKFFGSRNVYDHLLNLTKEDQINHPIFSSSYSDEKAKGKVENLTVQLHCHLTQLFNGCTKTVTYGKKILSQDGQNISLVNQTKVVQIVPGSSASKQIIFKGQGHHQPGYPVSDLVFKIVEVNQKNFKRQGNDLVYEETISLMQAIDSKTITIVINNFIQNQLNGKTIQITFDEIISPQTRRVVTGKGMPIDGNINNRGDLIVTFDIEFPEQLELSKKKQIVQLLKA